MEKTRQELIEELKNSFAEKWMADGWETGNMDFHECATPSIDKRHMKEYIDLEKDSFLSDLNALIGQIVPGEEELKRDCPQELSVRKASWFQGARYVINRLTGKE